MTMTSAKEAIYVNQPTTAWNLEQRRYVVAQLWLRGHPIHDIVEMVGVEVNAVLEDLREMRRQLREWQKDDLENLAAERIEVFRNIQLQSWQHLAANPRQANQLLGVVLRAEESIARIQGVLTDRVQHVVSGTLKHKLYDFEDRLPAPIVEGVVVADEEVVEVVVEEEGA